MRDHLDASLWDILYRPEGEITSTLEGSRQFAQEVSGPPHKAPVQLETQDEWRLLGCFQAWPSLCKL